MLPKIIKSNKCLFNEFIPLPNDLNKICTSYLNSIEQIYYNNEWDNFPHDSICTVAGENGWLDLLNYGHNYKRFPTWDSSACDMAAKNGHINILKWLRENEYVISFDASDIAARSGQFAVLEWLHQNMSEFTHWRSHTYAAAALGGHFDILKYLHKTCTFRCPWDESTCANAALIGRLDILIFAYDNGCPMNNHAYSLAASNGHLHVLKWAKARFKNINHLFTPWICYKAAKYKQLHILKWLRKNDCNCKGKYH